MSRRPGHELEQLDHYVYLHLNAANEVIYVGRTAHPDSRPGDDSKRPWIATESAEVRVSPPMSFTAAAWVEDQMICAALPRHNKRRGQRLPTDWRIDRLTAAFGTTRETARWSLRYWPRDPDAFEAQLTDTLAAAAALDGAA